MKTTHPAAPTITGATTTRTPSAATAEAARDLIASGRRYWLHRSHADQGQAIDETRLCDRMGREVDVDGYTVLRRAFGGESKFYLEAGGQAWPL